MTAMVLFGEISPWFVGVSVVLVFALVGIPLLLGMVLIQERQVGIIVKRFGARELPPGRLIALEGESGYQAGSVLI